MTRRDMLWRATGAILFVSGCAASAIDADGSRLTLLYFGSTILGIVLILNGKRVAISWQAERRGHCDTAAVIHAQRIRRRKHELESTGRGSST